jgi:hypothetical protein
MGGYTGIIHGMLRTAMNEVGLLAIGDSSKFEVSQKRRMT